MPLVAHAPPSPPSREACITQAAAYYSAAGDPVSRAGLADLVRAIIRTEGGTTGKIVWNKPNKHGERSYDMGLMQINSSHLKELARLGASREEVIQNECLNIFVGTWILKREIASSPSLWVAIGNYNSHTHSFNVTYQQHVWARLNQLWHGE